MKKFALALVSLLCVVGFASAQCHSGNLVASVVSNNYCAAPIVQAQLVQYVAPVVQLQQVVQAAPVIQQQIVQQQVQQVTVPTVPVVQYLVTQPQYVVQSVVQNYHSAAIVNGYNRSAAIVNVAPFARFRQAIVINQPRAIVVNRAPFASFRQAIVVRNPRAIVVNPPRAIVVNQRQPLVSVRVGGRR